MPQHDQIPSTGPALVLVRGSSVFLSTAAVDQREQRCVTLARDGGFDVHVAADAAAAFDGLGDVAVLITWALYGLTRDDREAALLAAAVAAGLVVLEAHSGALRRVEIRDVDALAGTLDLRTERHRHAARTREGRLAVARSGRWLGGRHPLGWHVDADGGAVLDQAAAAYIRSGTLRVAAGTSVGAVVAQWNHAGFRTASGREWAFGSARRVLLRARNAGLVEYRGEIVGRSSWPAIVTIAQWRQARAALLRTRKTARESA